MKNLLYSLLLSICLGMTCTAWSQTVYIAPKVGANFSNLSVSNDGGADYKSKLGINAGAMLMVAINPLFGLQTEMNLMSMGSKVEAANQEFDISLYYMEIPLLARLTFGQEESVQFFANGGPFLGLLLSADQVVDDDRTDISDTYTGSNFGVAFGGGILIPAGQGKFMLDARYGLGISDITDTSINEVNTRNFGITAGFLIDL